MSLFFPLNIFHMLFWCFCWLFTFTRNNIKRKCQCYTCKAFNVSTVLKGPLSGLRQFLKTESPLKMIKMAFIHVNSPFPSLDIYIFVLTLFIWKKGLKRELWLISKFITSEAGQQIILIHVLPNILISKDNRIMKFGLLIKYSVRNIFLAKLMQKMR